MITTGLEMISQDYYRKNRNTVVLLKINEIRYQVKSSAKFNGGEGIAYYQDKIYFATKGDNKIWCYDLYTFTYNVF